MNKKLILWIAAAIITFLASFLHQRIGPYYPVSGSIGIEGKKVTYFFEKVHYGKDDLIFRIRKDLAGLKGNLIIKKVQQDAWEEIPFSDQGNYLAASFQPLNSGNIIEYKAVLELKGQKYEIPANRKVNLVFLGMRPASVLYVLYFFLFGGLLIAVRGGMEYFNPDDKRILFSVLASMFFFVASIIFYPFIKSYELDVINKNIPSAASLFDIYLISIFVLWIVTTLLIIKTKKKVFMLISSAATLILFQLINLY
jgi:hypothetical protein